MEKGGKAMPFEFSWHGAHPRPEGALEKIDKAPGGGGELIGARNSGKEKHSVSLKR